MGSQRPTFRLVPPAAFSYGADAIELATIVGLELDPWQRNALRDGLGVDELDRWTSRTVEIEVARQNGKSVILEVRVLSGMFLFNERQIVYSAHRGETVMKAFERIEQLIDTAPELRREVKRIRRANGKEAIELKPSESRPGGCVVMFRTRTKGGGRGLFGDCVILDEDQDLADDHIAALLPLVRAQPNAQLWYAGSAGDYRATVKGRLLRSAEAGRKRMTCIRFAATEDDDPTSWRTWAKTNPALGRRVDVDSFLEETASMSDEDFAREILSIGTYPRADGEGWVIPRSAWEGPCCPRTASVDGKPGQPTSTAVGQIVLAIDAKPDRSWASISAAGHRPQGGVHVEVIEHARGLRYLVPRVVDLLAKHPIAAVVADPMSSVKSLFDDFTAAGVEIKLTTQDDMAKACGDFMEEASSPRPSVFHRGGTTLTSAIASATTRKLAGGLAFNRYGAADISPLVAAALARHGLLHMLEEPKAPSGPSLIIPSDRAMAGSDRIDLATVQF